MRRKNLHAGSLDILAELLGILPVEQSVLVAGGLHRSVTHVGELLQHGLVVLLVFAEAADQAAYRVELDADLLLRGLLRLGECSAGEHRQSQKGADRCK